MRSLRTLGFAVFGAVLSGGLLPGGGVALASPWAEVGDSQIRQDIELLNDSGLLNGPVMTWPIAWSQLNTALDSVSPYELAPPLRDAVLRLRARMAEESHDGIRFSAAARVTNEPAVMRTFDDNARDEGDLTMRVEATAGRFYGSVSAGWRNASNDHEFNQDNSYAAVQIGNWALMGGWFNQWWGPSSQGAMILSNNARPFPKVGFRRLNPRPFESRWLRWIGPWNLEAYVGKQDGPGNEPHDGPMIGLIRVSVKPHPRFELGVSRIMQLCGRGRSCSLKQWVTAFAPFSGQDNRGSAGGDIGNQEVGYDFRYAQPVPWGTLAAYAQFLAEDDVGDALSAMGGFHTTGYWNKVGTWQVGFEWFNTFAHRLFSPKVNGPAPGITYLHFTFPDGLHYRGRPMGYTLDGDSESWSFLGSLTDTRHRRYSLAVRRVDINKSNTARYTVSRTRERLWIGELGAALPTRFGDIRLITRYMSDRPNTPGRRRAQGQFEVSWRFSY